MSHGNCYFVTEWIESWGQELIVCRVLQIGEKESSDQDLGRDFETGRATGGHEGGVESGVGDAHTAFLVEGLLATSAGAGLAGWERGDSGGSGVGAGLGAGESGVGGLTEGLMGYKTRRQGRREKEEGRERRSAPRRMVFMLF